MRNQHPNKKIHTERLSEASFTLTEVLIAVLLLLILISQISGVFSNAVYFSDYARQATVASSLARALMNRVDYLYQNKEFKEFAAEEKDQVFEGFPDYTYDLSIKEWKFPIEQLLGAKAPPEEGEDASESSSAEGSGASGGGMGEGISQILGNDLFRVAFAEVFWVEGAKRNSISLTYLLTNQKKVDELGIQNKSNFEGPYRAALMGQASAVPSAPPKESTGTGTSSGSTPKPTPKASPTPRVSEGDLP